LPLICSEREARNPLASQAIIPKNGGISERVRLGIALFCCITILLSVALLYRHLTFTIFQPAWKFLLSENLAIPPILVTAAGYLILFLSGREIGKSTETMIRTIRTTLLQSLGWLCILIAILGLCLALTSLVLIRSTPPEYDRLVSQLLEGESDDFKVVTSTIDRIRSINANFADQLSLVVQVFATRAKLNFTGVLPDSTAPARILVRALETHSSDSWKNHPLRWHALGEAYSLYAQVSEHALTGMGSNSGPRPEELRSKSISLYMQVASTNSPLATLQLKRSALHNIGNQFLYGKDYEKAYEAWANANQQHRSLSTYGNLLAVLVLKGEYDRAIFISKEAKEWAQGTGRAVLQPSQYAGIPVSTGFAFWLKEDFKAALNEFAEAVSLIDDALNRLNYSYALILSNDAVRAVDYMRRFVQPINESNQSELVLKATAEQRCAYLLWALAEPLAPTSLNSARLNAFLGRSMTRDELAHTKLAELTNLRQEVYQQLKTGSRFCGDFSIIPATAKLLGLGSVDQNHVSDENKQKR
jgi:tetratricopeptide (TPR) repeat protein